MKNNKTETILSVIVPAFAMCAYFLAAFLAKNKGLKRTFTAMTSLMTGQLVTEIVNLSMNNKTEDI